MNMKNVIYLSQVGLNDSNEGGNVRLSLPQDSKQERREEIVVMARDGRGRELEKEGKDLEDIGGGVGTLQLGQLDHTTDLCQFHQF